MAVTDLTNTIWLFNDTVDLEDAELIDFGLNFKSNNVTYDTFSFSPGRTSTFIYYSVSPSRTQAYSTSAGWANTSYKVISITGGYDATNSHLISWLTNNATLLPSDLTGYTWTGNSTLTMSLTDDIFNINFTNNDVNYSSFRFVTSPVPDGSLIFLNYDFTTVYQDYGVGGFWFDDFYKTINITGGSDVTNSTLIAWLEENGTLTAPQPQPSASISIGNLSLAKSFIGDIEVSKIFLGNVKLYEKQAPQPTGWTFGVSGLTNSNPALTRTDDAVGKTWSKNSSTGLISTDFDEDFNFEEVVDGNNTFIRIPKMYYKRTTDTIQLSDHSQTGFEVHSLFVDESGNEMNYFDVGKYKAYMNGSKLESKANKTAYGSISITNGRTYARANNTSSYQYLIDDIRLVSFIWMLWMVVFATRNTEDVMGTSWYSYSGATTGNTDSLVNNNLTYPRSICAQDPTTHSFKFFGIEDIVGAGREWVDGIAFNNLDIYVAYKPSTYISPSKVSNLTDAGYIKLSYAQVNNSSGYTIKTMGLDNDNAAIMYPSEATTDTNYNTYYCDAQYTGSGIKAFCFGAYSFYAHEGLFCCSSNGDFSTANGTVRLRLCRQPI